MMCCVWGVCHCSWARYNIKYGKLDATDEEVETASDAAALTDAVAHMPKKLDTVVGERGLKLSGPLYMSLCVSVCARMHVFFCEVVSKCLPVFERGIVAQTWLSVDIAVSRSGELDTYTQAFLRCMFVCRENCVCVCVCV